MMESFSSPSSQTEERSPGNKAEVLRLMREAVEKVEKGGCFEPMKILAQVILNMSMEVVRQKRSRERQEEVEALSGVFERRIWKMASDNAHIVTVNACAKVIEVMADHFDRFNEMDRRRIQQSQGEIR